MEYSGTDNLEIMSDAVNYNAFLLEQLLNQLQTGDIAMDFGAGLGTFAEKLHGLGFAVTCLEPDLRQAAMITEKGLKVVTDLDEIPDASLDFVYSLNVLEHLEDDVGALRNLYRKIKSGGRILLYVPAFPLLFSAMDRKVGHLRRYVLPELRDKVQGAGFRVITIAYRDSLGFLVTLLYKAIGDGSGKVDKRSLVLYDRFIFPVSRRLDFMFSAIAGKNLLIIAEKVDQR